MLAGGQSDLGSTLMVNQPTYLTSLTKEKALGTGFTGSMGRLSSGGTEGRRKLSSVSNLTFSAPELCFKS